MKILIILPLTALLLAAIPTAGGAEESPVKAKTYSRFTALEPGSIRSDGWIRNYITTIANGWPLLYAKERVPVIYDQYWMRNGMTGDYAAYYGDSIIRLSHMLPETELAKDQLEPWLKKVLASQEEDGYLGGYPLKNRWGNGEPGGDQWLEIFSSSVMIQALLYRYQTTGDQSILNACERSAARIIQAYHQPESEVKHFIFGSHGTIVIRPMRDLYLLTGKQEYADFAKEVLGAHGKVNQYLQWYNSKDYDCVANAHSVIEEEHMSFPVTVYEMTGDESLKKAGIAAWEMINKYVTVSGQPTGNEGLVKPLAKALMEHCTGVDWTISNHEMLRILGDVRYADASERALFNSYPGSKSPDTITYAYIHQVNQLAAAEWTHPRDFDWEHWFSRTYYSSAHLPMCCGVNSPRAMAHFIDNMVYRNPEGGLAVVYYGPAHVKTPVDGAGNIEIVMDTQYPFEDVVKITVNPEKDASFPIQLRIPGWCSSAKIELNGKPVDEKAEPGKYAAIQREWHKGDLLTLSMEVPVKLIDYPVGELYAPGSAVERGPLTFVMLVAEDWQKFDARWVHGPARDKEHPSYRIFPEKGSSWNYALIVDKANPEKSFTLKQFPQDDKKVLWKDPIVGLEVKARKVLNWELEGTKARPETPGLPYTPMELSKKVTTVTLVPFGCTRLRMSYLPIIEK
ncbi:MAG: beta-L-arabinofuranosidase domain-containing protein [Armatimonadota bacterium]